MYRELRHHLDDDDLARLEILRPEVDRDGKRLVLTCSGRAEADSIDATYRPVLQRTVADVLGPTYTLDVVAGSAGGEKGGSMRAAVLILILLILPYFANAGGDEEALTAPTLEQLCDVPDPEACGDGTCDECEELTGTCAVDCAPEAEPGCPAGCVYGISLLFDRLGELEARVEELEAKAFEPGLPSTGVSETLLIDGPSGGQLVLW